MSLFRSKYGKSASNSRAVIRKLRNGEIRPLREKQLSAATQRTTSTEGTFYDNHNDSYKNESDDGDSYLWDSPSLSEAGNEIEFFRPTFLSRQSYSQTAGPVIRTRWRRRSDSIDDSSTIVNDTHHSTSLSGKMNFIKMDRKVRNRPRDKYDTPSYHRKDRIYMVDPTGEERRDDDTGTDGLQEELWGEPQIEVLRRSSLNHTKKNNDDNKPSYSYHGSQKSRRVFFKRPKLFGS